MPGNKVHYDDHLHLQTTTIDEVSGYAYSEAADVPEGWVADT